MTTLRNLPSVEQCLQTRAATDLMAAYGRPLTLEAVRQALADSRARLKAGTAADVPSLEEILAQAESHLRAWTAPTLFPVINATGVILHTNLGRAPLSQATVLAMQGVGQGYSNLEFDLESGKRGWRLIHAEALLKRLTGAEAAVVVNNNAAAVLLVLSALAKGKRVAIARSQQVEIGGSFRVPDVMRQSGAKLLEIGTTNKVHLRDYEDAIASGASLILCAHPSNFKIIGFTEEPDLREIVNLAHRSTLPVLYDLGSGALLDTARYGLTHEPTVQEVLAAGVDVVCFSGDKLLGGPQAGIIVGRADLLAKIKKHPLARAVRADKTCLAGLSATLLHYLKDEAEQEIPIWKMMAMPLEHIRSRAEAWRGEIGIGQVIEAESTIGGGSLPGESFPTWALALDVPSAEKFLSQLRQQTPPIIARVENKRILLDPRTVLPEQDSALLAGLKHTLKSIKQETK